MFWPGPAHPDDETRHWLARVEKVAPVLVQHREQAEQERMTPPDVIDALREQNIHRMWVSPAFGGGGVSVRTGSAVLQALARIDASVAWQMGVQGVIGRMSDYLPEQTAGRMFRESDGLVVGGINPSGHAEAVPGGYRVRGRWSFASGSTHADWLVCASLVTETSAAGEVAAGSKANSSAPAPPTTRMMFVPRDAVRFTDDWFTIGLRGTGSVSFTVDDLFVPEEHTVDGGLLRRLPAARPSRGYPIAYYDFGPFTTASTALGIAQDALSAFPGLAVSAVPARGTETLASSHTVQAGLARAAALVRAGELLLDDAAGHASARLIGGEKLSALIRLAATAAGENTLKAVDTLHGLAGTRALGAAGRLDRCFRDIHTVVAHITLAPTNFEMVGSYLLGGSLLMRR
ncbi:acyl-CoA dehydrogenase [Frankia casuarinae]|nr:MULTISPECIES: acyl-CoA dehydrogenase family protein [Frankia]ETA01391.1 acyl-CoA dehydrogenase [Frankia sp. CcI6]EYT90140.1 acyl-CoA dehydrogenase [Frankia casuarinae]KDA41405.1 acyl-CoA dehydrogenase [Frankia sp. BMG5.23]KFB05551.1 acyl-CoA dehydrogenase [Frankia sp. Allo2]OFB41853.1 acyl-CoA dehydrogenase [Frankia sp. CgIM4]